MKLSFINRFMYAPAGWVQDVCAGAPQRPCTQEYFNNYKDVGFRQNVVVSRDYVNNVTPFTVRFDKPFVLLSPYAAAKVVMVDSNAANSAVYPWNWPGLYPVATAFNACEPMGKLFQEMQECTVDNRALGVPVGSAIDGAVAFNSLPGGVNFNYYFNNKTAVNLSNKNAFIIPTQLVYTFWFMIATEGIAIQHAITVNMPLLMDVMKTDTDLRLWGTPGIYTIDPSNAAPWMAAFNTEFPARPGFFVLEQKSIE